MKFLKPKFWDKNEPSFLSYMLLPISFIYFMLSKIKIYKKKKIQNIKTICVGNIYIGGTGKTTLCLKISEIINSMGLSSCFVKKYYSSQIDEQKILKNNGELYCDNSRVSALKKINSEKINVAIFDDGLQDQKIKYDLSIVCFNKNIGLGNGFLIPSGPLRENLSSLKKYDAIFFNGNDKSESEFEKFIKEKFTHLKVFKSLYKIKNNENFDKKEKYLIFAGIGNFENLIEMLKINDFSIVKSLNYPDHYNYNQSDIDKIKKIANDNNAKIITTEKDFVKISHEDQKNINKIEVELDILNKDDFTNFLSKKI
tara:strand:- start:1637 stop:2572 length:936 start_codon:yes stop_codon:yes gene_type:complete